MTANDNLDIILRRHEEIGARLTEGVSGGEYATLSRELNDLEPVVSAIKGFRAKEKEQADLAAMLEDPDLDADMRAGTGGDEAALFAGDLFRMYVKYAESKRWKVELLSMSEGTAGGYKEIVAQISGRSVFARLKFESGVHRVQRVPTTETQGRVHTSAAT